MKLAHNNRQKVKSNNKGKLWCFGCDSYLVWQGQKCPVCGVRNGLKRYKKG